MAGMRRQVPRSEVEGRVRQWVLYVLNAWGNCGC